MCFFFPPFHHTFPSACSMDQMMSMLYIFLDFAIPSQRLLFIFLTPVLLHLRFQMWTAGRARIGVRTLFIASKSLPLGFFLLSPSSQILHGRSSTSVKFHNLSVFQSPLNEELPTVCKYLMCVLGCVQFSLRLIYIIKHPHTYIVLDVYFCQCVKQQQA